MSLENKKEIYKSIRRNIISHRLRPGQAIREEELAEKYKVSRTPIREIIQRLEAEGLVKIVPYKGATVTKVTTKDIKEILNIRLALEAQATHIATERANDQDLIRFSEIDEMLNRTLQTKDVKLSFEADNRLHSLIINVASNKRVKNIISNLIAQIHRLRYVSGHAPGRIEKSADEHKRIIQAILDKDSKLAEARMKEHLEYTKKLLLKSSEIEDDFVEISSVVGDEF